MSEVKHYKKLPLGETEIYFLYLISKGEKSAYDILSSIKTTSKSMAYKNVHLRVKKLEALGLIEAIEGRFGRNAIRYRMTAYGLFQCVILSSNRELTDGRFDRTPKTLLDPRIKKEFVFIQAILYRYFEEDTIKAVLDSSFWSQHLQDYLRETCETILTEVNKFNSSRSALIIGNMGYVSSKDMPNDSKEDFMVRAIDQLIEDKAKNFIYKLVVFSKEKKDALNRHNNVSGSIPSWRKNDTLNVITALAKDSKFLKLLKTINDEFYQACGIFL